MILCVVMLSMVNVGEVVRLQRENLLYLCSVQVLPVQRGPFSEVGCALGGRPM